MRRFMRPATSVALAELGARERANGNGHLHRAEVLDVLYVEGGWHGYDDAATLILEHWPSSTEPAARRMLDRLAAAGDLQRRLSWDGHAEFRSP